MTLEPTSCHRYRFPAEIISHAMWLYHLFSLNLRDVELILAVVKRYASRLISLMFLPQAGQQGVPAALC
jgi:hypothetical protein